MTTIKSIRHTALLTFACIAHTALLPSCSKLDSESQPNAITVDFSLVNNPGEKPSETDRMPENTVAYHFIDGKLEHTYKTGSGNGQVEIMAAKKKGTLYFISNCGLEYERGTGLDEFLSQEISSHPYQDGNIPMTGQAELDENTARVSVGLKRSLGRIVIDATAAGIEISAISLKGLPASGKLWPGQGKTASSDEWNPEFTFDNPVSGKSFTLCHVYEYENRRPSIEIEFTSEGAPHRIAADLPAKIGRNTSCTVKIKGNGADISAEIITGGWESGESDESISLKESPVNTELSDIPENVKLNASADTLTVPFSESLFRIVLNALENETEVKINGYADGVSVTETGSNGSGYRIIDIASITKVAGMPQQMINIDIYRRSDNSLRSRLTMIFERNPVELAGKLTFGPDRICDFGDYMDGELGVFTLPEGYIISAEIPEGIDPWMKMISVADLPGTYRILGGWRPNDPLADGRVQQASVTITSPEGTTETYTIRRRNYGLPVVKINGTWWCKYNARGNSRDFSEQVLSSNDPAAEAGMTVAEYLANCTEQEYLDLWGYLYQGKSGNGLKVIISGGIAKLEGYKYAQSDNIPALGKYELAPNGYELPATACYDSLMNNGMTVSRTDGPYTPKAQYSPTKKSWVRSYLRSGITIDGTVLPDLLHFEIYQKDSGVETGESITLYGPGDQWNDNGINTNSPLFACHSPGGVREWMVKSGIMREHAGLANDTRVLRFIKTPVEYIY